MSKVYHGDCLEVMAELESNSVDTVITDPPYGLTFMGKDWDHGVPGVRFWAEILRVTKPGGLLLAFGGTRTHHRLMVAIEDAGWELKDCLMWLYGQGFPKALDISAKLDQRAGAQREVSDQLLPGHSQGRNRTFGTNGQGIYGEAKNSVAYITAPATDLAKQWHGWKSPHLKPAWEPIILAEAPREGSYADNATKWGVAGLWIEGGRIEAGQDYYDIGIRLPSNKADTCYGQAKGKEDNWVKLSGNPNGRYPANVILDEDAAAALDEMSGELTSGGIVRSNKQRPYKSYSHLSRTPPLTALGYTDSGGASRFFYCAKASKRERGEYNTHPTVKPLSLLTYLAKLTRTPTGGVILDPFAGSMTTALAAIKTGRDYIMIEQDADYVAIGQRRIADLLAQGVQMELMQ